MYNVKDRTLPAHRLTSLVMPAPSLIPLGPDLWFDSDACVILRSGKPSPLTAREAAVLRILLQAPGRWHLADDLARQLKRRWPHINAHCIEQTICGLRRKLGESGKRTSILRNRYGLGYSIVPAVSSDDSTQASLQGSAAQVQPRANAHPFEQTLKKF
jgi:DNA-binding winged helix-turn-helix (wHTH) protein